MNNKKHLSIIFVNNKLLVYRQLNSNIEEPKNLVNGLGNLPELPSELAIYFEERQSLIVSSDYGKHWLIDIQHNQFEHALYQLLDLRELLSTLPSKDFQHIAQAWQYALFLRTHRYCGRCGHNMRKVKWEMAMHCDKCSHRVYPRVSPCIIVSIHNGSQILLAQGARHLTQGFYSTLAGFVESAESLEQAVHREVMEEVGLRLKSLEYMGSQPWPFPHSLMVGYIAQYESGEIKIDNKEIVDAQWFDIDNLPNIPSKISIAGTLIEETLRRIEQGR